LVITGNDIEKNKVARLFMAQGV